MRLLLLSGLALALVVPSAAAAELAAGTRATDDEWRMFVSVEPSTFGPIVVAVGPVRPAPWTCSRHCAPAWLQHEIAVTNTGDRPVTFRGLGLTAELGPRTRPALLVASGPCTYANSRRRITIACLTYLDIPSVGPHETERRTVTLWKGLAGMSHLRRGAYVARYPLRFVFGRRFPAEGEGRAGAVKLVYRVEPSS